MKKKNLILKLLIVLAMNTITVNSAFAMEDKDKKEEHKKDYLDKFYEDDKELDKQNEEDRSLNKINIKKESNEKEEENLNKIDENENQEYEGIDHEYFEIDENLFKPMTVDLNKKVDVDKIIEEIKQGKRSIPGEETDLSAKKFDNLLSEFELWFERYKGNFENYIFNIHDFQKFYYDRNSKQNLARTLGLGNSDINTLYGTFIDELEKMYGLKKVRVNETKFESMNKKRIENIYYFLDNYDPENSKEKAKIFNREIIAEIIYSFMKMLIRACKDSNCEIGKYGLIDIITFISSYDKEKPATEYKKEEINIRESLEKLINMDEYNKNENVIIIAKDADNYDAITTKFLDNMIKKLCEKRKILDEKYDEYKRYDDYDEVKREYDFRIQVLLSLRDIIELVEMVQGSFLTYEPAFGDEFYENDYKLMKSEEKKLRYKEEVIKRNLLKCPQLKNEKEVDELIKCAIKGKDYKGIPCKYFTDIFKRKEEKRTKYFFGY